jgi:DNA-binding SARP family transcriptional activator
MAVAEDSTATLDIQLLGGFRLLAGEMPVAGIDTPRLQALLAHLVLHPDAPQSRSHLAFRFWPDSTEAQARTNLRKQVHYLRRSLPDADRFLYADAKVLQWRPESPFRLDVADFEGSLAQAAEAGLNARHCWNRPWPATGGTCCPAATMTGCWRNASGYN